MFNLIWQAPFYLTICALFQCFCHTRIGSENIVTKEPSQYQLSTLTIPPCQKVIAEKKKHNKTTTTKKTNQKKNNRKKDELKLPAF